MNTRLLTLALAGVAFIATARAAIIIPGANGSDGALNITTDTVIDLSKAITGAWDANNAANAGKGVYDPAKWAVVFKYTEVNIAAGATVTFKNHASRAPVVWLVSGDVVVAGSINLNGQGGQLSPALAEPGPGGFRGGASSYPSVDASAGFGVGGAQQVGGNRGLGGVYVGNPSVLPLIGGSGGAGGRSEEGFGGGAGGGAILLACANSVTLAGNLSADGGVGPEYRNFTGGGGSGGGIRIVSEMLAGSGGLQAVAGFSDRAAGNGRIRVERVSNTASLTVVPDPSVIDLAAGSTALLWPPAGAPEVRVVSVGGSAALADPRAGFATIGADIALPGTESTPVIVETRNVEQASAVRVRGTPRSNGNFTEVNATVDSIVSNDPLVIRWVASLPVNIGYSAVQVRVVRP